MALKQYYDLYDKENLELLKQSKDKRNALAQTVKNTINANAQDTIQQIETAGEASIKDAEHAYDDVINIANVQRLVDERAVSEAMANMGMTDSGLNRTQQTAVQLSASRKIAEAQIARQKQIDALALQIRQNILDVEKQRSASLAEAETSRQADIMGIEDTYNTNRNKFATDMYEQTQKAEKERTEAEAEVLKDKAKARDNLLKIFYATNELGNSANSDEYKQQAALSFYKQYGADPIIDSYMKSMGWEIPKTTTKEDSLSASTETMVKELGRPELQTERYQKQSIAGKIQEWLEAGVIDDEQATYLLQLYGIPEDIFD